MRAIEQDVPLAPFTTLGVGGPARWFCALDTAADIPHAHTWARARSVPVLVLAGGSNVVISDRGFPGLVLHVRMRGMSSVPQTRGALVTVAAGEPWDPFVEWTIGQGWAGIECLSGIPGSVGATPIQNVGAYGQEVSSVIESVSAFDRQTEAMVTLDGQACGFSYRSSRFKHEDAGRFFVCAVTFRLQPGPPMVVYPDVRHHLSASHGGHTSLEDVRRAVLDVRRAKGMVLDADDLDTRSAGSFFMNPLVDASRVDAIQETIDSPVPQYPAGDGRVKLPAAWLLEHAGAHRGFGVGAVGLSSKHALAVTNRGGATAGAIIAFAASLKRRVESRFGVKLVPEPVLVGFEDEDDVRYLRTGDESPRSNAQ